MPRLGCVVDKEMFDKFEKKAASSGFKTSTYLRTVISADLKKPEETVTLKDVQKSIMGIIPVVFKMYCKVNEIPQEFCNKWVEEGMKEWRKISGL